MTRTSSSIPKKIQQKIGVGLIEECPTLATPLLEALDSSPHTYCVGVWKSSEQLLQEIGYKRPLLLLIDIDKEGIEGVESVKHLKRHLPDLQIMLLSVIVDVKRITRYLQAGASGVLIRPTFGENLGNFSPKIPFEREISIATTARSILSVLHKASEDSMIEKKCVPLSGQETVVVRMIAEGLYYREIADHLRIAESTVRSYVKNIFNKLNVRSRTEIAVKYVRWQQINSQPPQGMPYVLSKPDK